MNEFFERACVALGRAEECARAARTSEAAAWAAISQASAALGRVSGPVEGDVLFASRPGMPDPSGVLAQLEREQLEERAERRLKGAEND